MRTSNFKRFTLCKTLYTLMLIIVLVLPIFSPSFSSHASSVEDPDNTGGGTASYGTVGDKFALSGKMKGWSSENAGIRIYVINKQFQCVSVVHDFFWNTPPADVNYLRGTRYEPYSSGHTTSHSIQDLVNACSASTTPPNPWKGDSGGEELKAWFTGGKAGTVIHGQGTGDGSGGKYVKDGTKPDPRRKDETGNSSDTGSGTSGSVGGSTGYDGWKEHHPETPPGLDTVNGALRQYECVCEYLDKYETYATISPAIDNTQVTVERISAATAKLKYIDSIAWGSLVARIQGPSSPCMINRNYATIKLGYGISCISGWRDVDQATINIAIAIYRGTKTVQDLEKIAAQNSAPGGSGSGGRQVVKKQDDGNNGIFQSPSYNITPDDFDTIEGVYSINQLGELPLASSSSGTPIYNLANRTQNFWGMANIGFNTALEALITKEYWICMEPITWGWVGEKVGTTTNRKGKTVPVVKNAEDKQVLGTITNWTGYMTENFPKIASGSVYNFFSSVFKDGANIMRVGTSVPSLTGNGCVQQGASSDWGNGRASQIYDNITHGGGYSLHLYSSVDFEVGTSTCDEPNASVPQMPPDDNPATPDYPNGLPSGGRPKQPDGKYPKEVNIVKFYLTYDAEGKPIDSSRMNFTRTNTPNVIQIEEEQHLNGYKLTDWFYSPTFQRPPRQTDDYNTYKKTLPNSESGTSAALVTLEDPDTTLYVLLVKGEPPERVDPVNPSAKWHLEESQLTRRVNTNVEGIADKLDNKKFTITWGELEECGGHTVEKYEKTEDQTVDIPGNCNGYWVQWGTHYGIDFGGARCDDKSHQYDPDRPNDYRYSHPLKDQTIPGTDEWVEQPGLVYCTENYAGNQTGLSIQLEQTNTDDTTRAVVFGQKIRSTDGRSSNGTVIFNLGTNWKQAGSDSTTGFNYELVIHRGSKDMPCQYLAKTNVEDLSKLGFPASYSVLSGRSDHAIANRADNGKGQALTPVPLVFSTSKSTLVRKLSFTKPSLTLHNPAQNGDERLKDGNFDCSNTDTAVVSPASVSFDAPVTMDVWRGTYEAGINDTTCDTTQKDMSTGRNYRTGIMQPSQSKTQLPLIFVPYIKMRYDTMDSLDNVVYMLGCWNRYISPNDYYEIEWTETDSGNLNITSNQWSTHKTAIEQVEKLQGAGSAANSVLPGGAIYNLDTLNTVQEITVNTYCTIVEGAGRQQVEHFYQIDGLDRVQAKAKHAAFVESVKEALDDLNLVQWATSDMSMSDAWETGQEVYAGADISGLNTGSSKASTDAKYYFNKSSGLSTGANEADLDVKEVARPAATARSTVRARWTSSAM